MPHNEECKTNNNLRICRVTLRGEVVIFSIHRVGGWVGEIKNNDQLSPAEAETRAELGKNVKSKSTM